ISFRLTIRKGPRRAKFVQPYLLYKQSLQQSKCVTATVTNGDLCGSSEKGDAQGWQPDTCSQTSHREPDQPARSDPPHQRGRVPSSSIAHRGRTTVVLVQPSHTLQPG